MEIDEADDDDGHDYKMQHNNNNEFKLMRN